VSLAHCLFLLRWRAASHGHHDVAAGARFRPRRIAGHIAPAS